MFCSPRFRLARIAVLVCCLVPVASTVRANVHDPEWYVAAEAPADGFVVGERIELPLTLYVRASHVFDDATLRWPAAKSGAPELDLTETTGAGKALAPNGYVDYHFVLSGIWPSASDGIDFVVRFDGEEHSKTLSPQASVDAGPDPQRRDADSVPRIDAGLTSPTAPAGGPVAAGTKAQAVSPRTVRVHGRVAFIPDLSPDIRGCEGATVKVMEPVAVLDDNTLAATTTDANGDFDFNVTLDGAQDIYVKVEAANGTAVNVGTGLFFHTYNRHFDYPAYAGTDIDLGLMTWLDDFNGALGVTHMLTRAHAWTSSRGYPLSRIHVRYPDDSRSVSWYSHLDGTRGIHLHSTKVWTARTIIHEYGHHWVHEQADQVSPQYCNGMCEDFLCGHCFWCAENEDIAWSEGFPYWFSWQVANDHHRDYGWPLPGATGAELIQNCVNIGGFATPMSTEGAFSAFLQDLTDGHNENDEAFDSLATDRMVLPVAEILAVAHDDRPTSSRDFIADMRARIESRAGFYPQQRIDFWSTVRNNGLAVDGTPPLAPDYLTSTTHTPGVASPNSQPVIAMHGGMDDFSGVTGIFMTMTPDAPAPPDGSGVETIGTTALWETPLTPGTWWANVRSVDGAGNYSTGFVSFGPLEIAPPVPVDLAAVTPAFWEGPLVVRNDDTATPGAAGWPSTLTPGNVWFNLDFGNTSASGAPMDTLVYAVHIDGNTWHIDQIVQPFLGAGEDFPLVNMGPFPIRGGRHRLTGYWDAGHAIAETVEDNNTTGRSIVVEPPVFLSGAWQSMPAAPRSDGGRQLWSGVPDNMDGVRLIPPGTFAAILLEPGENHAEYDLNCFAPSHGVNDGFETPLARSRQVGDDVEGIVVNTVGAGLDTFDFGIASEYDVGGIGYSLRAHTGNVRTPGDDDVINWAPDDYMTLLQYDFGPAEVGPFTVAVSGDFDESDTIGTFRLFWMGPDDGFKTLSGAPSAYPNASGHASIFQQVDEPGSWCLVVYREVDAGDVTAAATITVDTRRSALPEIELPEEVPLWEGIFTPQASAALTDTVGLPGSLVGGQNPTYLYFLAQNAGQVPVPPITAQIEVDGIKLPSISLEDIPAGGTLEYRGNSSIFVDGGRHVLNLVLDPDDAFEEVFEQNNSYALQWGWTGPNLYDGLDLQRPSPPDADAGLADLATIFLADPTFSGEGAPLVQRTFAVPNCDGLRLDPQVVGGESLAGTAEAKAALGWIGSAVMPGAASNVDLRMYQGGMPAAEAFVNELATSTWAGGLSEYVLANMAGGASGLFDVGVVKVSGSEGYTAQGAVATRLQGAGQGGTFGQFQIQPDLVMQLFEFDLAPGLYSFKAVNADGIGELGLGLHAPQGPDQEPWQGKDDLRNGVPGAWGTGFGQDEEIVAEIPAGAGGTYCLAVWKATANDLPLGIHYSLQITGQPAPPEGVVIDGLADESFGAPRSVQTVQTAFGDNGLGQVDLADGSELDQAFGFIADGNLYLHLAGNLESNQNDLEIFFDSVPGGQERLRGDNATVAGDALGRMGDDGGGNGLHFDPAFDADRYLTVTGTEAPFVLAAYMAELPTGGGGQGWFLGMGSAGSSGLLYGPSPEVDNPHGVRATLDNSNTGGVDAGTGPASGAGVHSGIELAIPLAALGSPTGCVRVCAFVNGVEHDFVSNQVLGPLPPNTGNLGEPRDVDFENLAGDQYFTVCPFGVSAVDDDVPPAAIAAVLHAPVPNPFNPRTSIAFDLVRAGTVDIAIYDAAGRRVRSLLAGENLPAGAHAVTWLGDDDRGQRLASGIYFVRMVTAGVSQVQQMVLLK